MRAAPKRLPRRWARVFTGRFPMSLPAEIARRRTFAIISHPDAGKTTLTEKFLLYGNAIHLAGAVRDRKNQRATTSDWMELERQRGISISSTVLQFDYGGRAVNLLDTPGHKDFSEDTYRVLTAVDAVLMVIDAAKGVEAQTRKLFEVCRRRGIPIFTFMNKCDRPTRDPIALLDELEAVLGIQASPVVWPLGNGTVVPRRLRPPDGAGAPVRARAGGRLPGAGAGHLARGPRRPGPRSTTRRSPRSSEQLRMLDGAGHPFDLEAVRAGRQTPGLLRERGQQFRDPAPPRRLPRGLDPAPAEALRRRRRPPGGAGRPRASSRPSSSRSRPTWTRGTATGSPSCASARASSRGT